MKRKLFFGLLMAFGALVMLPACDKGEDDEKITDSVETPGDDIDNPEDGTDTPDDPEVGGGDTYGDEDENIVFGWKTEMSPQLDYDCNGNLTDNTELTHGELQLAAGVEPTYYIFSGESPLGPWTVGKPEWFTLAEPVCVASERNIWQVGVDRVSRNTVEERYAAIVFISPAFTHIYTSAEGCLDPQRYINPALSSMDVASTHVLVQQADTQNAAIEIYDGWKNDYPDVNFTTFLPEPHQIWDGVAEYYKLTNGDDPQIMPDITVNRPLGKYEIYADNGSSAKYTWRKSDGQVKNNGTWCNFYCTSASLNSKKWQFGLSTPDSEMPEAYILFYEEEEDSKPYALLMIEIAEPDNEYDPNAPFIFLYGEDVVQRGLATITRLTSGKIWEKTGKLNSAYLLNFKGSDEEGLVITIPELSSGAGVERYGTGNFPIAYWLDWTKSAEADNTYVFTVNKSLITSYPATTILRTYIGPLWTGYFLVLNIESWD